MSDEKDRKFAELCASVLKSPPDDEVMALGYLMRDWLRSAVVDGGTEVDAGAGLGGFDLWATVGGKNVLIQIKEKA